MPEEEIQKRGKLLKDKFEKCKTIVGTQQLHSFEPAEDNKVKVLTTPLADDFNVITKCEIKHQNILSDIESKIDSLGYSIKTPKCRSITIKMAEYTKEIENRLILGVLVPDPNESIHFG